MNTQAIIEAVTETHPEVTLTALEQENVVWFEIEIPFFAPISEAYAYTMTDEQIIISLSRGISRTYPTDDL